MHVAVYFLAVGAYFSYRFGLSLWDSIYFGIVTCTTVGYGDISATGTSHTPGRGVDYVVNMIAILYGLVVVFAPINNFINTYLTKVQNVILKALDDDPTHTRPEDQGEAKLGLACLLLVLIPCGGAVFFAVNEGWSFVDALYWSFITAMTIGYGDLSLVQPSSRIFSVFYIVISVVSIAKVAELNTEVAHERAKEQKLLALKKRARDPNFLMEILESSDDVDGQVDKGEFLEFVLCRMGLCSEADTRPILKRFVALDVDGSGALDGEDFELMLAQEAEKAQRLAEWEEAHASGGRKGSGWEEAAWIVGRKLTQLTTGQDEAHVSYARKVTGPRPDNGGRQASEMQAAGAGGGEAAEWADSFPEHGQAGSEAAAAAAAAAAAGTGVLDARMSLEQSKKLSICGEGTTAFTNPLLAGDPNPNAAKGKRPTRAAL